MGANGFETEARHHIEYLERIIRAAANPYPRDGDFPLKPEMKGYRRFRLSIRAASKARLRMKKMILARRFMQAGAA